jgi:hypothetical protein
MPMRHRVAAASWVGRRIWKGSRWWWEACELEPDEGPGWRNEQSMAQRRGAVRAAFFERFPEDTQAQQETGRARQVPAGGLRLGG